MSRTIYIKNLKKEYSSRNNQGKKERYVALENLDLEIHQGEFLAILGPSGCGKSTLLNILAGLDQQTSGDILVGDQSLSKNRLAIGMVFQGYALFPWRTVLRNVEIGLEIKGVPKNKRKEIARTYLSLVGLENYIHHYPSELSGGMKQRVAIARALAYDPEILMMDEPFAALDAQMRELLQMELLQIWEKTNKTVLFVTHSIDEAIFLADRIAVMTARPGHVKKVFSVQLPRPRTEELRNSIQFITLRQKVWELIKDEVGTFQRFEKADVIHSKDTEALDGFAPVGGRPVAEVAETVK